MASISQEDLFKKAEYYKEELKKLEDAGAKDGIVYDCIDNLFNSYKTVIKDLFRIRI